MDERLLKSSFVKLWYSNSRLSREKIFVIGSSPQGERSTFEQFGGGVSDFNCKVEGQNIIVSLKFIIPFQTLAFSDNPALKSEIKNFFNLNNTWGAQLGRAGNKNDYCYIPNLRVGETQIEYSTSIRGIEIDMTLHGAFFSVLNYIKLNNLKKFDRSRGNTFSKENLEKEFGYITLKGIISAILKSTRKYVELTSAERLAINDPSFLPPDILTPPDPVGIPFTIESSSRNEDRLKKLAIYEEEDAIIGATGDLIPTYNNLKKIIVAESPEEAKKSYEKSWKGALNETNIIKKIYEEPDINDRTSVYAYISAILHEKALQIVPAPQISNSTEELNILVIPIGAIQGGPDSGLFEYEIKDDSYIGGKINSSDYSSSVFDLQTIGNAVLSVQASTNKGEQNLASIAQAKKLSEDNASIEEELSIYNFYEKTSKNITIECIGIPRITYYDNINIRFMSEVFTGLYKVISFTHKVTGNKFTTEFEAIRLEKGISSKANNALADEVSEDQRRREQGKFKNWLEDISGEFSDNTVGTDGRTFTEEADYNESIGLPRTGRGLKISR